MSSSSATELSVVVPVCNEAENVLPLAREVARALEGRRFELLFVDDASTDGTADAVRKARTQVAQHHAQGETQVSHHAADLSAPRPAGAAPARTSRPRPPAAPRR